MFNLLGYTCFDKDGSLDIQLYKDCLKKVREELESGETRILIKLESYALKDLKYLFTTSICYLNVSAHPDLKNKNKINSAIDTEKMDVQPILKRLYAILID